MTSLETMYAVIAGHAEHTPDAPAIGAPEREFLTYRGLLQQIDETVAALNRSSIGRGDWVATALPNGPEAAVSLVAPARDVALKSGGSRLPLFICLHGDLNSVVLYRQVIYNLEADQPVFGIRLPAGSLTRRRSAGQGDYREPPEDSGSEQEPVEAPT